jgi:hypothetical protein
MKNSKKRFLNTLVTLLCSFMFLASCDNGKEEPKSPACDIVLFSVEGKTWTVNGTNITRTYPAETVEGPLSSIVINLSPGATVNPPASEAQNFFTEQGVTYTVTAEDGVSKKIYTAKATRTPHSDCAIVSFSVDGVEWSIVNDSLITYVYPVETVEGPLTPIITLSPGAKVNPPSGEAKNFFTAEGVEYTVTSEDGAKTKTYIARARKISSECEILAFSAGGVEWTVDGTFITCIYSATVAPMMMPSITLSPGATISPSASAPQNFFTEQGVTYTVTAEDGKASKNYTVKATLQISGATGACTWLFDNGTLTIRGNGAMENYDANGSPWNIYRNSITTIIIEEGVTSVGDRAFMGNPEFSEYIRLASVTIPSSVTTIGYASFAYCDRLADVTLGNSIVTVGDFAFYACKKLGSIIIPNTATTIGTAAFDYCNSLASLTIGNSVTTIGEYAFMECTGLTSVTIPGSVTTIHGQAFAYCKGLTEVINLSTVPQHIDGHKVFNEVNTDALTLKVPANSVDAYRAAAEWKEFGNITGI